MTAADPAVGAAAALAGARRRRGRRRARPAAQPRPGGHHLDGRGVAARRRPRRPPRRPREGALRRAARRLGGTRRRPGRGAGRRGPRSSSSSPRSSRSTPRRWPASASTPRRSPASASPSRSSARGRCAAPRSPPAAPAPTSPGSSSSSSTPSTSPTAAPPSSAATGSPRSSPATARSASATGSTRPSSSASSTDWRRRPRRHHLSPRTADRGAPRRRRPATRLPPSVTAAPHLLVITGPTATGKTPLAVAVAERLGTVELVNADSRQVIRGLEVGTCAPAAAELRGVPCHLLGVRDPGEHLHRRRLAAPRPPRGRGHPPPRRAPPRRRRHRLLHRRARRRPRPRRRRARPRPPGSGVSPSPRAPRGATGWPPNSSPATRWGRRDRPPQSAEGGACAGDPRRPRQPRGAGTRPGDRRDPDRAQLRAPAPPPARRGSQPPARRRRRAARRGGGGARPGVSRAALDAAGIGYREALALRDGLCGGDEAVDLLVRRTLRYAKAQRTWFRRDPRIRWIERDAGPVDSLAGEVIDALHQDARSGERLPGRRRP